MSAKDLKSILGFSILYTGRLMVNKINKYFIEVGADITTEQMKALFYIWINEENVVIQQDLAEIMNKSKSAVLRTIDILEKKNFVTRKPFHNDRRKHMLFTTQEGKEIAEKAIEIFKEQEKLLLEKVDRIDMQTCMKVLSTIQSGCEDPCKG